MPKSRSEILVCLLIGALGCAPTAERVSVSLPAETSSFLTPMLPARPNEVVRTQAVVPAVPGRIGFVGSGALQAKQVLEIAQANQEHAYKEAQEELRHFYRSEAYAAARERNANIATEYSARMKSLYVDLRRLFDIHADKVGPKWTRLATIVGFPERANAVRRPPPAADFIGVKEYKEAETLRKDISTLQSEYRAKVTAQVEDVQQEFRLKRSDLAAERAVALDQADQRAESEARKLAADILKNLEASFIEDFVDLPPVQGTTLTVSSQMTTQPWPSRPSAPAWSEADRKRQLLAMFARKNGYTIVAAAPGVRDVTKEFEAWVGVR